MSDTEMQGDVLPVHNPAVAPVMTGKTVWARVKDGVVEELRSFGVGLPHPFTGTEDRVVNVTAVPCAPGYVMDTAGNVAPPASKAVGAGDLPYLPGPGAAPLLGKEPVPEMTKDAEPSEAAQAQHDAAVDDAKAE